MDATCHMVLLASRRAHTQHAVAEGGGGVADRNVGDEREGVVGGHTVFSHTRRWPGAVHTAQ